MLIFNCTSLSQDLRTIKDQQGNLLWLNLMQEKVKESSPPQEARMPGILKEDSSGPYFKLWQGLSFLLILHLCRHFPVLTSFWISVTSGKGTILIGPLDTVLQRLSELSDCSPYLYFYFLSLIIYFFQGSPLLFFARFFVVLSKRGLIIRFGSPGEIFGFPSVNHVWKNYTTENKDHPVRILGKAWKKGCEPA